MSLDQKEVLENLISQRKELEGSIGQLQGQLEQSRTQYLKVSGAIDVLSQLIESEEEVSKTEEEE
jgi:hypothetical protein